MRNMRKLPPILIAAFIVVLLSGCNQMLDAIYPDRQIVSVDVELSFPSSYVNVQLLDASTRTISSVVLSSPSAVDSRGFYHYYFQFTRLKNATYELYTLASGRPATYYFFDPGNVRTYYVSVPYYQSSDITSLLVVP